MAVIAVITTTVGVSDVDQAVRDYNDLFGIVPAAPVERMPDPPMFSAFAPFRPPAGGAMTVMQSTIEDGVVNRFIRRRGEGVFSVSLRVDDMDATREVLLANGQEMILPEHHVLEGGGLVGGIRVRTGRTNFVRPSAKTHGVLYELVEYPDE